MIPLRISSLRLANKWPKYIIIHHTNCSIEGGEIYFDNQKFQTPKLNKLNYIKNGNPNTKFHFIVEKAMNDYHVIISTPLLTHINYPDIPDEYKDSIHVGLLGNYDEDIPENRLYQILSFKLLFPLMRLFYIKESGVKFHSTLSQIGEITCPGEFVDMVRLKTFMRKYRRVRPVARK